MKRTVVLCLSLSFLLFPLMSSAQKETEKALALVRESYASLTGLKARFVQTDERPEVGVTVREEGEISFHPPDRMRWDYEGERPHVFILNGRKVWMHTPSRNQVVVREMTPDEMRRGAATFLGGLEGIEDDFTIQSRKIPEGESIPLDLFPILEAPYEKISILVSPENGLVERISIHHKLGNVTTITFHQIKTGVKLADKLFEWDIPEGTEIIEP